MIPNIENSMNVSDRPFPFHRNLDLESRLRCSTLSDRNEPAVKRDRFSEQRVIADQGLG
jgi:hypothetical protein